MVRVAEHWMSSVLLDWKEGNIEPLLVIVVALFALPVLLVALSMSIWLVASLDGTVVPNDDEHPLLKRRR